MKNKVVVIRKWGTFEDDHLDEWRKIKHTGKMGYAEFINQKRKEIGLTPMKYMEHEIFDEKLFTFSIIKYGIVSHNLDEVLWGVNY